MRSLILASIRFYQRWISPYKGFTCAHAALHHQGSCSAYGYQVFAEHGLLEAYRLLMVRFQECKLAKEELVEKAKRKVNECGDECGPDCASGAMDGICAVGTCDGCDVGACDIGTLDCGDIGSCSP